MKDYAMIEQIEKAIKRPPVDWAGCCSALAWTLINSKLVKGEFRYGLWWGPISKKCKKFRDRSFTHHAWVEAPEGVIADPTRWVFEAVKPYVYFGYNDDGYYDAGGNRLLHQRGAVPPVYDVSAKRAVLDLKIGSEAHSFVGSILGHPPGITWEMVHWLAHLSLDVLGDHAEPIYRAVIRGGNEACLPFDNRKMVLGKE